MTQQTAAFFTGNEIILLNALTAEFDIPWTLKLAGAIGIAGIASYLLFSTYSRQQQDARCFTIATEWVLLADSNPAQLTNPKQSEFFATKLASYHLACPRGHIIVDEKSIPSALLELAKQGRISDAAKRELAQKEKRNP